MSESLVFVQIASYYVGQWLADVLPKKTIRVPFTSFSFSLNPGPWHVKENVLVTVPTIACAVRDGIPAMIVMLYSTTLVSLTLTLHLIT